MSSRLWLFVLSCIALIASAHTFIIRGDILQEMGKEFAFEQRDNGFVEGAVFFGMAGSMLLGAFICDVIGMKNIMWLAFLSHASSTLATVYVPEFGDRNQTLWWLAGWAFVMGCGNGFTETAINPLAATLFPRQKTHYLNILHAWWPGGLMIAGLIVRVVGNGLDLGFGDPAVADVEGAGWLWRQRLMLILVPTAIYGLMLITSKFPKTERVASGISHGEMLMQAIRPGFFLWGFCMLLTASTELGPQKWQESVMTSVAGLSGTQILIYTSLLMFILRHFAGPIAHRISPVGLLLGSAVLSAAGLYLLSMATRETAFLYATVFGLGIAYFWPTMLGVTAERYPRGGAMSLCLMGTFGNLAIAYAIPAIGEIVDRYSVAEVRKIEADETVADQILMKDAKGNPTALDLQKVDSLKRAASALSASPEAENPFPDLSKEQVTNLAKTGDEAMKVGFATAFRWFSVLPTILIFLFGIIWLYDFARGGYQAEHLDVDEAVSEAYAEQ